MSILSSIRNGIDFVDSFRGSDTSDHLPDFMTSWVARDPYGNHLGTVTVMGRDDEAALALAWRYYRAERVSFLAELPVGRQEVSYADKGERRGGGIWRKREALGYRIRQGDASK